LATRSEPARQLDEVLAELRPTLKQHGFRVRARAFNRTTSDGLTQVVQFQLGSFQPPGTQEVPGLRANLYGLFTVNLGVYVPEVARSGAGEAGSFVPEYCCCIRTRLGYVGPENEDVWWEARADQSLVADLGERLDRDGFPFLERFATRDAIVAELSSVERQGIGSTPSRITCAIILAKRGRHAEARDLLRAQADETLNPHHAEYVRQLAERLGVGSLGS
jgi:hypothetical protein